ncbi:Exosome complex component rrp46 [Tolypocladium capitatum]|uniref:Exosome complex component rrp46 n=1 Tax=Tolypocladium capitatum TaxID=45235 RepID=A0A2K3Q820_9HYPO|nr:Exosome complex component rrp46 [Tolypocladium capitatum]
MAPSAQPTAELSHLPKADGSATYSYCGFTVTAAVNGPVEAPRRDENAFEALVDVIVRPAAGPGGTAERQLESILQPALRQLIPIRNFPRCMIQIALQVMEMPENSYAITKLLQAQLAIATATTLAVGVEGSDDDIVVDPGMAEADKAQSMHVLGFTSDDELLMVESAGSFTAEEWGKILQTGQRICCQDHDSGLDTAMSGDGLQSQSIRAFVRSVIRTKTSADLYWK